jgi:hypothetical protein
MKIQHALEVVEKLVEYSLQVHRDNYPDQDLEDHILEIEDLYTEPFEICDDESNPEEVCLDLGELILDAVNTIKKELK